AGAARGAGAVVNVEPVADQRRVADAAVHLQGQARRGADACERALLVQGEDGDGVVAVRGGSALAGGARAAAPLLAAEVLPLADALRGVERLQREALLLGEHPGAFADEQQ